MCKENPWNLTDLSIQFKKVIVFFPVFCASGSGVSCIATEAESGTLAVADNGGRLLVYVQQPRKCEAKEPNES